MKYRLELPQEMIYDQRRMHAWSLIHLHVNPMTGTAVRSLRDWAHLFRWEKKSVRVFFRYLADNGLIQLSKRGKTTVLTLSGYLTVPDFAVDNQRVNSNQSPDTDPDTDPNGVFDRCSENMELVDNQQQTRCKSNVPKIPVSDLKNPPIDISYPKRPEQNKDNIGPKGPHPNTSGVGFGLVGPSCSKAAPSLQEKAARIMQEWNDLAKEMGFPEIRQMNATRKRHISARLKEFPDRKDWKDLFTRIRECPYLANESWFTFDFVIRSGDNFEKVRRKWLSWKVKRKTAPNHFTSPDSVINRESIIIDQSNSGNP